jgi:hypothetical protein
LIVYKSFLRGVYAIADNIAARKSIGRGALCASELMATQPPSRPPFGKIFFPKQTLSPRTVINRDGVQILQCNRQTITRKRSCTGKQDGARFA